MKIRIASRESRLAVIQAQMVIDSLREHCPEADVELLTMRTTGDRILDRTLDQVGGKGLFVKELDAALLEGRADLTVHSFKDMPMELTAGLPIVAVSRREDPRDALVLPTGAAERPEKLPIGCSSLRRTLQLRALFPDAVIEPVRGNVQTRLRKLDEGQYGALVLACAGLRRLGLQRRISRVFSVEEMLPAACQGVLAVQARADFDGALLAPFHDPDAAACAEAERAFVRALDGGCTSPVAAYAVIGPDGAMTLTGLDVDEADGVHKRTIRTRRERCAADAAALALAMKNGEYER